MFTLDRSLYRAWFTNLELTPAGVWNFHDGRAGMERRIRERREDYAPRKVPTRAFAANALYLDLTTPRVFGHFNQNTAVLTPDLGNRPIVWSLWSLWFLSTPPLPLPSRSAPPQKKNPKFSLDDTTTVVLPR